MFEKLGIDKRNAFEQAEELSELYKTAVASVDPDRGPEISRAIILIEEALQEMSLFLTRAAGHSENTPGGTGTFIVQCSKEIEASTPEQAAAEAFELLCNSQSKQFLVRGNGSERSICVGASPQILSSQ